MPSIGCVPTLSLSLSVCRYQSGPFLPIRFDSIRTAERSHKQQILSPDQCRQLKSVHHLLIAVVVIVVVVVVMVCIIVSYACACVCVCVCVCVNGCGARACACGFVAMWDDGGVLCARLLRGLITRTLSASSVWVAWTA